MPAPPLSPTILSLTMGLQSMRILQMQTPTRFHTLSLAMRQHEGHTAQRPPRTSTPLHGTRRRVSAPIRSFRGHILYRSFSHFRVQNSIIADERSAWRARVECVCLQLWQPGPGMEARIGLHCGSFRRAGLAGRRCWIVGRMSSNKWPPIEGKDDFPSAWKN